MDRPPSHARSTRLYPRDEIRREKLSGQTGCYPPGDEKSEADVLLVSALDEIAWTLNIRGNDVHCNPVVVSYLIINEQETHFFIQPEKVTEELSAYLEEAGVTIHAYGDTESL